MTRVLAISLAPLLVFGLAPAAPVPKGAAEVPPLFFPTRVGDRMVHRIGENEHATVVTAVEELKTGKKVTVGYEQNDGKVAEQMTVEVTPEGVLQASAYGRELDPPLWILRVSPKNDGCWTGRWPVGCNGGIVFEEQVYTAHGWETVEVPAGKFRALRVDRTGTLGDRTDLTTYWYAPGVGCVKWAAKNCGNNWGSELKSFTAGKGSLRLR